MRFDKFAHLFLLRYKFSQTTTLGELYINGEFLCYTLEDAYRGEIKIAGITCVQANTYNVVLNMSPKFKRILPLLIDVDNFTGVRMHKLNSHEETDGCIGVGLRVDDEKMIIWRSKEAEELLVEKLTGYKAVLLTIVNGE